MAALLKARDESRGDGAGGNAVADWATNSAPHENTLLLSFHLQVRTSSSFEVWLKLSLANIVIICLSTGRNRFTGTGIKSGYRVRAWFDGSAWPASG
jgi:hypothetical protein